MLADVVITFLSPANLHGCAKMDLLGPPSHVGGKQYVSRHFASGHIPQGFSGIARVAGRAAFHG
jgi:hypothetical protein